MVELDSWWARRCPASGWYVDDVYDDLDDQALSALNAKGQGLNLDPQTFCDFKFDFKFLISVAAAVALSLGTLPAPGGYCCGDVNAVNLVNEYGV